METLSRRLRHETREAHRVAEGTDVVARLVTGRLDRATYTRMLRNLHALYAALEHALDAARADPTVAAVRFATLDRAAALARDLSHFAGPRWADELGPPTAATRGYAAHLAELRAARPSLLVAHAYVRYLGDLAGGQMLAPLVRAAYGLAGEAGAEYYRFAGAPAELRARYREALDALPLAPADADALVGEAVAAFGWSTRLLESVAAEPEPARP